MSGIEFLNEDCFCFSLDHDALSHALDAELGSPGLSALMHERCPTLFAAQPVFVAPQHLQRMAQVVRAVEAVVAMPAYREQVLASAPAIARLPAAGGPRGVFFGHDFHLDHGRLGLIEVNTNAGGAMLNAALARAQRSCCAAMDAMVPTRANVAAFEERLVDMFRHEWRLAGHETSQHSIAIVDENPPAQYLYPEPLCSGGCSSATACARWSLARARFTGTTAGSVTKIRPSTWSTTGSPTSTSSCPAAPRCARPGWRRPWC